MQLVTFQANIATNGSTTYVSYVYDDEGMLWKEEWIRPRVGYATTQATIISQKILNYGGYKSFRFDSVVGNRGYKGRYLWKLANNLDNNAAKCYEWSNAQPSGRHINIIRSHKGSQCPRSSFQALFDRGFTFSRYVVGGFCYTQRQTWYFSGTSLSFHVSCCYDYRGALIRDNNPASKELSTHTFISLKHWWVDIWLYPKRCHLSRSNAIMDDSTAFEFCCVKSSLCKLFEEKRPMPIHGKYIPPWLGMSFCTIYRVFIDEIFASKTKKWKDKTKIWKANLLNN